MNHSRLDYNTNRRVLAVDDEPAILQTYRETLEVQHSQTVMGQLASLAEVELNLNGDHGGDLFDLTTVESGEQAVQQVIEASEQEQPFFLALVDMRMPGGISGMETAERIREIDPNIYIVIVTAYSDINPAEIHKRLQYGFLYLSKPFHFEELLQIARNFRQAWGRDRELEHKMELERELHRQEQYNAWLSGMREMNSSVLHNIGNALVSIEHGSWDINQVTAGLVRLPEVLEHFAAELEGMTDPDLRAEKVREQYAELAQWITREVEGKLQQSSEQLRKVVSHVVEVMQMHQQGNQGGEQSVQLMVGQLVKDALLVLDSYANNRKIEVIQSFDERLPSVVWPRNLMVQVLVNLFKNAFEAIEIRNREDDAFLKGSEPGRVEIKARPIQGQLELTIRDNGIGVSDAFREKLFTFGQTSKEQGSGVGLHWVRQQMNAYGGNVSLNSEGECKGATVSLTLPFQIDIEREGK